ncbi:hypothetical protein Nepgr_012071 [Nepenthes gracilis]|uniref:Uncharacterized protein n=1 Tax=Nepenthes gracilis TaxID=150966 RepID=A0AAD3XN06_NEPGR|nr:hypothetical protein Nepgr_012071 [Nepenthes gracilis]
MVQSTELVILESALANRKAVDKKLNGASTDECHESSIHQYRVFGWTFKARDSRKRKQNQLRGTVAGEMDGRGDAINKGDFDYEIEIQGLTA